MNLVAALFCSSLGKKYTMAVTGLVLIGFVAGHLVGNLQIFSHPDRINGYAAFLQGLGPGLWIVRVVLLLAVGLHLWAGVSLILENRRARPARYQAEHVIQASLASRTMKWTGLVVLAFVIYHLAHFTLGFAQSGTFKDALALWTMTADVKQLGILLAPAGAQVHDVYSMVFLGFGNPVVSLFYIIAVGLLSFHLSHGFESAFQSLGLRTHKWADVLRYTTKAFCVLYFLGNLAIPGLILAGVARPAEGTTAHKVLVQKLPLESLVARH